MTTVANKDNGGGEATEEAVLWAPTDDIVTRRSPLQERIRNDMVEEEGCAAVHAVPIGEMEAEDDRRPDQLTEICVHRRRHIIHGVIAQDFEKINAVFCGEEEAVLEIRPQDTVEGAVVNGTHRKLSIY